MSADRNNNTSLPGGAPVPVRQGAPTITHLKGGGSMTKNMYTELCYDGVNRPLVTTVPRVLTEEELDHDGD